MNDQAFAARLCLVIECVTCGRPITDSSQAWRCCPEHRDKYGPDEWECADLLRRAHAGEAPDLIYAEEYANSEHERPDDA